MTLLGSLKSSMASKKAQSAFEFLLIVAFMTLLFVSLFSLANSALADAKEQRVMKTAEGIAGLVEKQITLASMLSDGYSSSFLIPQTVEGSSYSLTIIDEMEVVVVYSGYEHVIFLASNVSGNATFGENSISKRDGKVYLNS